MNADCVARDLGVGTMNAESGRESRAGRMTGGSRNVKQAARSCDFQGLRQFQDFNVGRAFRPVVSPADDHVTAVFSVAMPEEVAAFKFKLNADALPHAAGDFEHGFAVGKVRLDAQDDKAEPSRKHSKNEDHAQLIHRFMRHFRQHHGPTINRAIAVNGALADARADEGPAGFALVRDFGVTELEHVLPVALEFGLAREFAESFRDARPMAVAGVKRHVAETAGAFIFMHAGNLAELAGNGGPVEQQSGFGQAKAGPGGFQSGGSQGASQAAKAFVNDLLRDSAKQAEIAEAGVAAKFLGGKTDGFEDLWLGHGDARSGRQSFRHFSLANGKATQFGWRMGLL